MTDTQKTVYIAGPMTGIKQWNFPAFFAAEEQLSELGYNVINPAHNDGPDLKSALKSAGTPENPNNTWESYIRRDLPHVLRSDILCLLPGWQNSRGARLEVHVAKSIGIPLMILSEGQLVPRVTCIGISGYAQTGKDTVANRLVAKHGFTKVSFADAIREALLRLNPRVEVPGVGYMKLSAAYQTSGDNPWEALKKNGTEVRELLQRMGTEVGREMFGDDFWVNYAIDNIPDGARVVIADVRYPNEANAVRGLGGEVWRVVRKGVGPVNDHPSENALDDYEFDATIKNNFDLGTLGLKIDYLVGVL